MKEKKKRAYSTTDLLLAAAFMCVGLVPKIGKNKEGMGIFIFDDDEKIIPLAQDYWNGVMEIDPRKYSFFIKELKARVRNVF